MKKICSAGVVTYRILDGVREYLLLHYLGGHWDFPKGKMEPGETKQETALRELKEETGLVVALNPDFEQSFSYTFRDKDKQIADKTVYFFIGQSEGQKVRISEEHQLYSWLDYDQAMYRLTYENARKILEKVEAFLNKNNI